MKVRVNGEEREVPDGASVRDLLERLGLPDVGVAVAVDQQVVPRGSHADVALRDGCTVEVIRAVGGG